MCVLCGNKSAKSKRFLLNATIKVTIAVPETVTVLTSPDAFNLQIKPTWTLQLPSSMPIHM